MKKFNETIEATITDGRIVRLDISRKTCEKFGFHHGDIAISPNSNEVKIEGVGPDENGQKVLYYVTLNPHIKGKVCSWKEEPNLIKAGFVLVKTSAECIFEDVLRYDLRDFWDRALTVFKNFGWGSSDRITNILLHATQIGQNKVGEVLHLMEEHYDKCLKHQHPNIRGKTRKTREFFGEIYKEILSPG